MSERPQGEGWWIASDGRWYPPELHPDAVAARGAGAPAGAPADGGGSQLPQQTGGWAAPAPDPWIARMQEQAAAGGAPAGGGATWAAGPAAPARRVRGRALPRRKAGFVALAVVLLAGAGVGVALALSSGSTAPNTPRGVAEAVANDFRSGSLPSLCNLAEPSAQSACRVSELIPGAFKLTTRDLAVGVVTQQGGQALAVLTGTVCVSGGPIASPQCVTNSDPNVALDKGRSFAQAFAAAQGSNTSANFTVPMVDLAGKWYLSIP